MIVLELQIVVEFRIVDTPKQTPKSFCLPANMAGV